MEDRHWGGPVAGRTRRSERTIGRHATSHGRHARSAPSHPTPSHPTDDPSATAKPAQQPGAIRRAVTLLRDYLPRGNTLDAQAFHRRHLLLSWVLALHVPALFAFGLWQGFGVSHTALEVAVPAACVGLARLARNRRLAAFFVTAGLVYCSSALVHLSNGTIEAHFHFFILIGLIALYQDWIPFLWNVVFTVLSHGLGSAIAADLMYNHGAAQNRPWSWAVIHGVAVLAACIGVIVFWKNTELEQRRSAGLASDLAASELAAVQTEAAQRQSVSELFVNLARRNQSLLDRQLQLIAALEQHEHKPETLTSLFRLDHLATRIRRNAESLLVLSGDEPPRLWGRPVPLTEVVRAGAAEVEDYRRVEVLVSDYLEVAGRVVSDLAHLFAELIENATTFSPPAAAVRVRSHLVPGQGARHVLSIEDIGIGMSDADLRTANELLAAPPEVDLRRSTLGFHVAARLAQRLGLGVSLAHTPGGGVTALVTLPDDLVSERRGPSPAVVAVNPPVETMAGAALGPGPVAPTWGRPPAGVTDRPWTDAAPVPASAGAGLAVAAPVATPAAVPAPLAAPVPPPPWSGPPPAGITADGLVRRVPGANLTTSLRRSGPAQAAAGAAGATE
ncbi:MAG: sensor histidine kinase, partial [Acidimicrobiales bacterium]